VAVLLYARLPVFICAVGMLLGAVPRVQAQVVFNPANGHYYEAVSVPAGISWLNARDAAAGHTYLGRKGHLVTITSAAEQQFVVTNLPQAVTGNYWLGGYQDRTASDYSEPAGGWRWVTGEPWSYTFWSSGQPSNFLNVEDYLNFYTSDGGWNDAANLGSIGVPGYVVEYEFAAHLFDVNGDGHSDLVFQHSTTGQVVFWYMNGTTVTGGASASLTPVGGYKIRGTGDFNEDGSSDLVFQNSASGQIVVWFMNGTRVLGGSSVALVPLAGYQVVGVGDFNGDGFPDLVLQNATTNKVVIWFMNGTTVTSGSFISLTPDTGYQVVGVNDLNADGAPDLVLQNSQTNQIVIWYLNGITVTNGVSLPMPAAGYKVAAVSAFNGTLPGIVLQNSITNQVVFWYLDGGNVIGGGLASGIPDSSYQIVGPR